MKCVELLIGSDVWIVVVSQSSESEFTLSQLACQVDGSELVKFHEEEKSYSSVAVGSRQPRGGRL